MNAVGALSGSKWYSSSGLLRNSDCRASVISANASASFLVSLFETELSPAMATAAKFAKRAALFRRRLSSAASRWRNPRSAVGRLLV